MTDHETNSPLRLSAKRRRLSLDFKKCIICQTVNLTIPLSTAGERGISSLRKAAAVSKDEVYERLKTIDGEEEGVMYHKSCFTSYQRNYSFEGSEEAKENMCPYTTRSRSISSTIRWDRCLICQKRKKKTSGEVALHTVVTKDTEATIKNAAKECKDDAFRTLICNENLIFRAAKYHLSCFATYTNKQHLIPRINVCSKNSEVGKYSDTFHMLIEDIDADLMTNKKVFTLSSLLDKFLKLLPEGTEADSYQSKRLERRLLSHYGNQICIETQRGQGKSNLVFSSAVSKGDAIKVAGELKRSLKAIEIDGELTNQVPDCENDLSILHKAVGILRREMENLPQDSSCYPSSDEVDLDASIRFVPPLLLKTVMWLTDKKSFDGGLDGQSCSASESTDTIRKALSLSECIIFSNIKGPTPLHVGLAAQLFHDYGSKHLIETLSAYGFCITYDDMRRLTTTLAKGQIQKIQEGIYVPPKLLTVHDGGQLIQEGADNIDINVETIDGKNTFHAMGRVVFQQQALHQQLGSVKSLQLVREKSLALEDECKPLIECLQYKKPLQRPEPPKRDNVLQLLSTCANRGDGDVSLDQHNLTWVMLRIVSRGLLSSPSVEAQGLPKTQTIPFWTGYNFLLTKPEGEVYKKTCVTYKPIIDSSPTDLSTVYTTMKHCQQMSSALGQAYSVQTMDQQLYALAQQVKWGSHEELKSHVLRLGGFHNLCVFIAAIGKIWGDGGLRDMLVDSGVYAGNTADQMMLGKQFHRSVRGLTLAYEALVTLLLSEFSRKQDDAISVSVWENLSSAHKSFEAADQASFADVTTKLQQTLTSDLQENLLKFKKWGSEQSPTFKFWLMFIDVCEILLHNIFAERAGKWLMHLQSLHAMLPYIFATNRTNYSRWLPVYLLDMVADIPEGLKRQFLDGQFAVRETLRSFNGIWTDMATEKTIIRDSKSSSGIVGLTRKDSALVRWSVTRHMLGDYASKMKERSGAQTSSFQLHEQSHASSIKRDEAHVISIIEHIKTNMSNPFDIDSHPDEILINIATGLHASADMQQSILNVVPLGEKMLKSFAQNSLDSTGCKSFYSPIHKSGLKTFSDLTKTTRLLKQGKTSAVSISPELVFRRALALSATRDNITTEKILSVPVTSVPTALFHEDGTFRKCQKSELMQKLEMKTVSQIQLAPFDKKRTVVIRDAMADIHKMKGGEKDFNSLARKYMKLVCDSFSVAETVIDVWDRYDNPHSVKVHERQRRGDASTRDLKTYQVIGGRVVPPWSKFLLLSQNKAALANFLGNFMAKEGPQHEEIKHTENTLLISGAYTDGVVTRSATHLGFKDCFELYTTHEEADTRIIFLAWKVQQLQPVGRIVIKSPDTDVIVLAIHYFPQMSNLEELWFETGNVTSTSDHRRFVPVHDICKSLGPTFVQILPAVHALSGCDSVSSFFRIGKKTVMKVIEEKGAEHFLSLHNFSKEGSCDVDVARLFVASLYDPKGNYTKYHSNLNSLRIQMASKHVSLNQLPPSEPAFKEHVNRAAWQAKLWFCCHIPHPPVESPEGHGWKKENELLLPIFFEGPTASELLRGLVCSCSNEVCTRNCGCLKGGLSCCEACPCSASEFCTNRHTRGVDIEED